MSSIIESIKLSFTDIDNAPVINRAMESLSAGGGGTLRLAKGTYSIGTLYLKSDVTLSLDKGCVLQGVEDSDLYGVIDLDPLGGSAAGNSYPTKNYSLIIGEDVENFRIEGEGEVRGIGNGPFGGGAASQAGFCPNLVVLKNCSDFEITSLSLRYSSYWTLHMLRCSNVLVDGVTIETHPRLIGASGIDPDGCQSVRIQNCRVHSADDPFTVKSSEGDANRNLVVQDCEFKSFFGGIKIGTESVGEFEDIRIERCRVLSSWVGLCLYMKDGGSFKRIVFRDIEFTTRAPFALVVDNTPRFYKTSKPGEIEGIEFQNLNFSGPGRMLLEGFEGHPIRNLRMDNIAFQNTGEVDLTTAKKPNGCGLVELDPERDIHANRPYYIIGARVEDFRITNVRITDKVGRLPDGVGFLYLHGCQAGNIDLHGNLRTGAASHLLEDVSGVSFALNGQPITRVAENLNDRFSKEKMGWIWTGEEVPPRNAYIGFKKEFNLQKGERARLRLTADSRYILWVNGKRAGIGPARAWPAHWEVDEYDLTELCQEGANLIAVLVLAYGEGTMQYIPNAPGMAAAITIRDGQSGGARTLYSDETWQSKVSQGFDSGAPRMSLQMAFEERFDATKENAWWEPGMQDCGWKDSEAILAPHPRLRLREIPLLESEEWAPKQITDFSVVKPSRYHWTINLRAYCCPHEKLSAPIIYKGHLFTQIHSPKDQDIQFMRPHWYHQGPMFLNGEEIGRLPGGFSRAAIKENAKLVKGWNRLIIPLPDYFPKEEGVDYGVSLFPQISIDVDTEEAVTWSARGELDVPDLEAFAFLGPFRYTDEEAEELRGKIHSFVVASPREFAQGGTVENCARVQDEVNSWEAGSPVNAMEALSAFEGVYQAIAAKDALCDDVFLAAIADTPIDLGETVFDPDLSDAHEHAFEIPSIEDDTYALRFLVDFGDMVVGDHEIEIDAPEGAMIDVHNFEFIQKDGRQNYAEGMNNTFRYTCREGRQSYRSVVRRGFQYSWIIVRNAKRPVTFHKIRAHFVAYPQKNTGSFSCDDRLLNRIWEVGAHTLRCCSEDVYTDCPTYEQVFWVGDGRNEALVDWMVNGDPRLWYRCLRLSGESLERSAIIESHLPSAERSILPAWVFLWMRSCREYLLFTGDFPGATKLFRFVRRNFEGIRQCLNDDGLFEIHAWNMFDWAAMDTPNEGVVTHNNCFLVLALNETAELADWLGEGHWAEVFRDQANKVRLAINSHLWSDEEGAYIDCVHKDGKPSTVFSQQTQTVALRANVPDTVQRRGMCREKAFSPPESFVKSGSPFFQFFILEILSEEKQYQKILDSVRENWGFMIEEGASTFWEMWSLRTGRLTRSHCHGWSAAPTYFLSTEVLGIHPVSPGFSRIRFCPQLGDLEKAEGAIPTPHGILKVEVWRDGDEVFGDLEVPEGIDVVDTIGVTLVEKVPQ
ncbi:family 78 glycoside hydrolase catalytic domain [Pelagicoccus mobilis]|uniref:Family 78 glycoside hydrolase catalytic domain n=1 Tax=Pelagicoccus mobilis TaxID=415221 RepID=A0A934RZJ9_9BACT|nr:family 78 glycoside hydrolase catalytic domain [Pelagicoccus mobilis]MBK1877197.1 family 78 glycoside hydrolase catalytic domain [Pelagicoccus mobilis]